MTLLRSLAPWAFVCALAMAFVGLPLVARQPDTAAVAAVGRLPIGEAFAETGFRLEDERFATYFYARGGIATFGYPTSRRFFLGNAQVQFFQRHVMQLHGDGRVTLLNLLEPDILPGPNLGNAVIPTEAPHLVEGAPSFAVADYADALSLFVALHVPNEWNGLSVGFLDAYLLPGRIAGAVDPITQVLIGAEIYGLPTSAPAYDPTNNGFVYQRFQRGVLHFDSTSGTTQPLLLADYLKALLTGRSLSPELATQAAATGNRFYHQYSPARPYWILFPELMPGSDLTGAFESDDRSFAGALPAAPQLALPPRLPNGSAGAAPLSASGAARPATTPAAAPAPAVLPTGVPTATPLSVQPTPTPSPTPNPAPPVIERTEPGSVAIGQDLLIRGTGFGQQPGHVLFTGKLTAAQVWSNTHIIVTVPDGVRDGTIRIRREDGAFSNEVGFAPAPTPTPDPGLNAVPTATPVPGAPTLTELSPQQGVPNSTLLVQGTNFGPVVGQVIVGNSQALIDSNGWSNTSIVARVPSDLSGPAAVKVFVRRGSDGQITGFRCFQLLQPTPTTTGSTPTPTPAATPTATTSC